MIGFVIPVKPKRFSKNWEYDTLLLSRTLKSILQQTNSGFKIFVIYNDKPNITWESDVVKWICFSSQFVEVGDIADYESLIKRWHNPDYAEKMFDKGRKIMLGCKLAKEAGCKYLMAVDSDDLVSNQIAGFVNKQDETNPGWVINKGYMYLEGAPALLKNKSIQNINGSTHIVRSDLVKIPNMTSRLFTDFNFFEAHGYLFFRIRKEYNLSLDKLPFYGVMYIIHKNNSSNVKDVLNLKKLKTLIKFIIYGKILTKTIKNNFGLYSLH